MQNWFPTLNAALEAEDLIDRWPLGLNVAYGQNVGFATGGRWVSIYRDEQGRYERPVHYATQMVDTYSTGA